jgi:DHA2 family methylenomycin A resistance protein-like MFS transporter
MVTGLLVAAAGVALLATSTAEAAICHCCPRCWDGASDSDSLRQQLSLPRSPPHHPIAQAWASGVNNTARQAGGAIGIAVYGAIAGEPSNASRFLAGLHLTGIITAGLFVAGALISLFFIPRLPSRRRVQPLRASEIAHRGAEKE